MSHTLLSQAEYLQVRLSQLSLGLFDQALGNLLSSYDQRCRIDQQQPGFGVIGAAGTSGCLNECTIAVMSIYR